MWGFYLHFRAGARPDFALEPEALWTKFSELSFGRDIDFAEYPEFSRKYYLRGDDEPAIRRFFTEELIEFLQTQEPMHVESYRGKLLVYRKRAEASAADLKVMIDFVESLLVSAISAKQTA